MIIDETPQTHAQFIDCRSVCGHAKIMQVSND